MSGIAREAFFRDLATNFATDNFDGLPTFVDRRLVVLELDAKVDVLEDLHARMDKLPNYTAGLLTHTGQYGQGWDDALAAVFDLMVKVTKEHAKIKEPVR